MTLISLKFIGSQNQISNYSFNNWKKTTSTGKTAFLLTRLQEAVKRKNAVFAHFLGVGPYTTHLVPLSPFPHISKKDKSSLQSSSKLVMQSPWGHRCKWKSFMNCPCHGSRWHIVHLLLSWSNFNLNFSCYLFFLPSSLKLRNMLRSWLIIFILFPLKLVEKCGWSSGTVDEMIGLWNILPDLFGWNLEALRPIGKNLGFRPERPRPESCCHLFCAVWARYFPSWDSQFPYIWNTNHNSHLSLL